jgi:hypothetical protein
MIYLYNSYWWWACISCITLALHSSWKIQVSQACVVWPSPQCHGDRCTDIRLLNKVKWSCQFLNYKKGCIRLAAASDTAYQLLVHGPWFSLGILASSTTKTGHHDIAETLLKVALNTKNQNQIKSFLTQLDTSQPSMCCLTFTSMSWWQVYWYSIVK